MQGTSYWAATDQLPGYHTGGLTPPKLLAEAKSDENERRQRVRDLTRPRPVARRIEKLSNLREIEPGAPEPIL